MFCCTIGNLTNNGSCRSKIEHKICISNQRIPILYKSLTNLI